MSRMRSARRRSASISARLVLPTRIGPSRAMYLGGSVALRVRTGVRLRALLIDQNNINLRRPTTCTLACGMMSSAFVFHPNSPARVLRFAEHFEYGTLGQRMTQLRRQFPQRQQHKPPLAHPRVRNRQGRRMNDGIFIEQDINVNQPRPFGNTAAAAERSFDALRRLEELQRHQLRPGFDHAVHKPGLRPEINRLSLVKGAYPFGLNTDLAELFERPADVLNPVSKIRAQRKINALG